MSSVAKQLKTSKEVFYGWLMLLAGLVIWLLFLASVFADFMIRPAVGFLITFYFLGIVLFSLIAAAWYRARAFGNMVMLGHHQFPELYAVVTHGAKALGMPAAPVTFLYNSNGMVNAFARRIFGGRYVFLTSGLVEAQSDAQVKFVIGHELGHHAAGHLNFFSHFLRLPGHFVPFLGSAYSRARESSCDRIGAVLSGDVAASVSALGMLSCGCRRLNGGLNCDALMDQEALVPPVFGFISEIFRSHPRITRRMAAIRHGVSTGTTASVLKGRDMPGFPPAAGD